MTPAACLASVRAKIGTYARRLVAVFDLAEALPLGHGPYERDDRFRGMGALGLFGAREQTG